MGVKDTDPESIATTSSSSSASTTADLSRLFAPSAPITYNRASKDKVLHKVKGAAYEISAFRLSTTKVDRDMFLVASIDRSDGSPKYESDSVLKALFVTLSKKHDPLEKYVFKAEESTITS